MLDVELGRVGPPPLDAATILCLREGPSGLEVLFVERHPSSKFLGGAVVFPGGKLDPSDRDPRFLEHATTPRAPSCPIAPDEPTLVALAVAAARECFEEAGLLFHRGEPKSEVTRRALRERLAKGAPFVELLAEAALGLDLGAFIPFARWITPKSEHRRFDTRFYLATAPSSQHAMHDAHETTSAFWSAPRAILERFSRAECALFPPTHRSLELLEGARDLAAAVAIAEAGSLEQICPELVNHVDEGGETLALVLPGDPSHSCRDPIVRGRSRYVLRGEQWLPEDGRAGPYMSPPLRPR